MTPATRSVAPRWLEPRTWEAFGAELGERAACALDAEERWGPGSAVLRLHEANERPAGPVVIVPELDLAVVGAVGRQNTPR
jgi:hypothetical protein